MTHRYREYRGLHGETVRVLTHTITQTTPHYDRGSFPFVEMARGLGMDRDRFALIALRARPFYSDAMRDPAAGTFKAQRDTVTA